MNSNLPLWISIILVALGQVVAAVYFFGGLSARVHHLETRKPEPEKPLQQDSRNSFTDAVDGGMLSQARQRNEQVAKIAAIEATLQMLVPMVQRIGERLDDLIAAKTR